MALRSVRSLNPEEWKELMAHLDRGPTKEQREMTKKAKELFKELKTED